MRVAFFMDFVQDIDLIEPLLVEALKHPEIQPAAWMTERLLQSAPRAAKSVRSLGIPSANAHHRTVLWTKKFPCRSIDALVTASESTLAVHWVANTLTRRARFSGVRAYTLQHGLENVGLTYVDARHTGRVGFASETIFIWGPADSLVNGVRESTRARSVPVGCPKRVISEPITLQIAGGRPLVAVFENLHWHRYSEHYRAQFREDLFATCRKFRERLFILRPHQAGKWSLSGKFSDAVLPNLVIASPELPWLKDIPAADMLAAASAVITTPSTIALDSARAERPVAVIANDLALPRYAPLPLLRRAADWDAFLEGATSAALEQNRIFLSSKLVPGDAAARILHRILADEHDVSVARSATSRSQRSALRPRGLRNEQKGAYTVA